MRNMKNIYYCRSYYDPDEAEIRVISEETNVCLCDLEESFYDCWLCSKYTTMWCLLFIMLLIILIWK